MERYEIIIYWSAEDEAFVAEVPELAGALAAPKAARLARSQKPPKGRRSSGGCMAHGDTYEAALSSAREAMRLWMDTAKEFGDSIPEPKGRRLVFA